MNRRVVGGVAVVTATLLSCHDWSGATVSAATSDVSPQLATATMQLPNGTVTFKLTNTGEEGHVPDGHWAVSLPVRSCP